MEGKKFSYGEVALPQATALTNFKFDLQRFDDYVGFSGTDDKWKVGTDVGGHAITQEDLDGYSEQGTHKIAVDADGDGNYDRYFDYMQSATNYILGNAVTGESRGNAAQYSASGATIRLLDDITNADGFYVGVTKDDDLTTKKNNLKTNVTIDLNGHQLLFKYELRKGNAGGVNKSKAIVVEHDQSSEDGGTSVTIKNGTIGIAEDSTANFERLIRSYANLTLDNVVLDGSKLSSAQEKNFDGALLCHTKGNLNLTGNTEIKVQADGYYAVSGKLADNGGGNSGTFTINVQDNASIPSIGIFEWGTSYWGSGTSFAKGKVNISGGTVGEIAFSEKAIKWGAMNVVTISGGTVGAIESISSDISSSILAYAESSEDVDYDTVTKKSKSSDGHGILYGLGFKDNWNVSSSDSDKYNYVAASVGADATLKAGQIVLSVDGVSDKSALKLDGAHSLFAIPASSTDYTWGGTEGSASVNYALAKVAYSSDDTAATVSGVTAGSGITTGVSLYSGDYTIGSGDDTVKGTGILSDKVQKIDASGSNVALAIIGNTLNNTIYGGTADDSLTGNGGNNVFVYNAGKDVITDYTVGDNGDKVVLTDADFVPDGSKIATVSNGTATDLVINFDDNNKLTFAGRGDLTTDYLPMGGVKVETSKKAYIYTNYSIADATNGKANGVTLNSNAATASNKSFTAANPFTTIDGSAISLEGSTFDIKGSSNDNYIVAAQTGGALDGNGGNDTLVGGKGNDTFVYASGKGVINGYSAGDSLSFANVDNITGAKTTGNKLIFTIDSKNSLTFNPVDEVAVEKVSLTGDGGVLTANGKVADNLLTLFKDAKGRIDAEELGATGGVNAAATSNKITLSAAAEAGGQYIFAANKKTDVFEYNGGANVSLSGFESGKDKVNLYDAFTGFSVGEDNAVSLKIDDANALVIENAKGSEINLNNGGRRYSKMTFSESGIIKDKASNATSVTLYSGLTDNTYNATNDAKVKKINFADNLTTTLTVTGNKQNNVIDASDFGTAGATGFNIGGGEGNDKITGSKGNDTFVYTAGKDVISGFASGDSISLGDGLDLKTAKINTSSNKKSVAIKFSGKNALNIKSDSAIQSISFNGTDYTLGKNWLMSSGDDAQVSLTSTYGGTFKTKDSTTKVINGTQVKKSLTFTGTSDPETLIGGANKTKFKGGGGADSLVGGTGTDTFFYAKGNTGDAVIAGFESGKDKLKIASGILTSISTGTDDLKLTMGDGKKNGNSSAGSFTLEDIKSNKALLKANNTYYWFEEGTFTDSDGDEQTGAWVTSLGRVSATAAKAATGYSIVDLGYSTNLVKVGLAYKSDEVSFTNSGAVNNHSTTTTTEG